MEKTHVIFIIGALKYRSLHSSNAIYIFTRQVDDNPTNGPDKSTKKILVDESTGHVFKHFF